MIRATTSPVLRNHDHVGPTSVPRVTIVLLMTAAMLSGCSGDDDSSANTSASSPPIQSAPADLADAPLSARELRRLLKANRNAEFQKVGGEIVEAKLLDSGVTDLVPLKGLSLRLLDLGRCEVDDISALEGMPLRQLWLEDTQVADISVLAGMPLEQLFLQNTGVSDISMLDGAPLQQLNLLGTKVSDISVVSSMPLQTLWVPKTEVSDISALEGMSLVSLDIQDTSVSDISVLSSIASLKRLNLAGSAVTDLTPLKGLSLDRLLLTPSRIESGIDVVREMSSIRQIGTSFEEQSQDAAGVAEFWKKYDEGAFKEQTPPESDS